MNEERLLRLADKLDGTGPYVDIGPIADGMFSLSSWSDIFNERRCAVGWAMQDPWFNDQGLLKTGRETPIMSEVPEGYHFVASMGREILTDHSWFSVMKFFGISMDDASSLFTVSGYARKACVTPAICAANIRSFVRLHADNAADQRKRRQVIIDTLQNHSLPPPMVAIPNWCGEFVEMAASEPA